MLVVVEPFNRDEEGRAHGDDLAPGVDAPPEPADEIEQAGAGADEQDDVEGVLGGVEDEGEEAGAEEDEYRRESGP